MYLCVYHRGGCVKSPRAHVLGWINLGTALQCFLPSSTVGGGRHSVRQRKDRRVSTSHFTSPAAADTASTWPGQVALSPMTSTGTGQQVCDNGAVTRRAEKDSAVGVRDVGEDRAGSVAWVSAIRDRAGRAIKANARQCHQDQWYGDSAGQCHQGQCYRDSATGTAPSTAIRLHAVGTEQAVSLPWAVQQDPSPGVLSPVPTLRHPTRGILPVTSACERGGGGAGGAAFPSAGAGGREAPAGLMGCEGGLGGGVGDRREGNASWVALSESCSDLQPGGRCCRRQRQRSPTPPGSRVPV